MGRRTETTEYLKECIANALISLMKEKPVGRIKAQEITDLAKVGRATYFRYFSSREDVLEYKLLCLWNRWTEQHPFPYRGTDYDHALWFFSFCASISSLLRLLYEQSQYMSVINAYLAFTAPMAMENKNAQVEYKRMFFAYGIHGIITEWIKNDFRESPEALAMMCVP